MGYIAKVNVRHNGVLYVPGDRITGIEENEAARLVSLRAIVSDGSQPLLDTESEDGHDPLGNLTAAAFAELKASEQKSMLQELGMTPESSADKRVKQYATWISKQEEGGV